ncbi:MAG: response regulator [Armatimonadota bacterium]
MRDQRDRRPGSLSTPPEVSTVLLVDDDPAALRLLYRIFERSGWRIIEATNGREALAACSANEQIDLIVSDVQMPEMDGFAMCRSMDGNGAGPPVILVSGSNIGADEALSAGGSVAAFFSKPFNVSELMSTALAMLGS